MSRTLYLFDKLTKAPLAEIHVSDDATVGALRSHIRDCPEMAAFPQRMFSHWWLKSRSSLLLTEIPLTDDEDGDDICQRFLDEVGIEDEGHLLLELRGVGGEGGDDNETDGNGYAAAVVSADRRLEQQLARMERTLSEQMRSHAARLEERTAARMRALELSSEKQLRLMNRRLSKLKKENAILKKQVGDLGQHAQRVEAFGTVIREAIARPTTASSGPVNPILTVATPCGPSSYTITYPNGGSVAEVQGHEQYYNLPAGQKGKLHPFHLPNARVPAGARCLIEFSYRKVAAQNTVSFRFGFAPRNSPAHANPLQWYSSATDSYMFAPHSLGGPSVLKGPTKIADLQQIGAGYDTKRRFALLLDRSDKENTILRPFMSDDGTVDAMKPLENDKVVIQLEEASEYVPVANLIDRMYFTVQNIYFGDQIPPNYIL